MSINDKTDPGLPISNNIKRESASLLPQIYRTDSNKKFLQSTLDQLTQPGTVKKVNGFIGRQYSKATSGADIFLTASDSIRQSYQLEPAAIIKDYLGNVTFYKDYIDHINHIDMFNGNVSNHERLNKQEFYSWSPHINFDKFVNYQNYYWMPRGPKAINIFGKQGDDIQTEMPVSVVDDGDNFSYVFDKSIQTRNPDLILYRGQTYIFDVNCKNQPFYIKTHRVSGPGSAYNNGVVNNGTMDGKLTFTIGKNTPGVLYYNSGLDEQLSGLIKIFDVTDNTYLNIEEDILHKTQYKMQNGHMLSNGMKLKFKGHVAPSKYSTGYWYVEGVGTAIKLISEVDIAMPSSISSISKFDYDPFDTIAFDVSSSFPHEKDYIIINRSSVDRNLWSRSNRWFHQDVIKISAEINNMAPSLDQQFRAIRPIIEFDANLKLFNFGHVAKADITLIDMNTTDVFSNIEGSLSYSVDGVNLSEGMRVIFTADTDSMVKNKTFIVNFITISVPGRVVEFDGSFISNTNYTISFSGSPNIPLGSQVTYLNNGYPSITGLTNRAMYYTKYIDDNTIQLYTDANLTKLIKIQATGIGSHRLELFSGKRRQIKLTKDIDSDAILNQTLLVKSGVRYGGKLVWFNGNSWVLGQLKTNTNQPPLFDIHDINGYSYSNVSIYPNTTFKGTSLFSYTTANGIIDSELGFPIKYRSINNVGDISFTFHLLSDTFQYTNSAKVITETIDVGYLISIKTESDIEYVNGWTTSLVDNIQPIIRIYKNSGLLNNFPIDVYDNINKLLDLKVKVYINGHRLAETEYSIVDGVIKKTVILNNPVISSDIVTLKCYSSQVKNENGYYEIPISLQNNPLNDNINEFTLGQVIDHVHGIIENIEKFAGSFPGIGNLRDLPEPEKYGIKFVQHSCPLNFSIYHLGSRTSNVIDALDMAESDYGKFKRAFLTFAESIGIDTEPKEHVDYILAEMTKNKPANSPYYLSDMFAHSGHVRYEYKVLDSRTKIYPLSTTFDMSILSNKAVLIYLNDNQLLYGIDYTIVEDFFTINVILNVDDVIVAYEYNSTDGSCCPPTPTKLGLYPKFKPKIYIDDTYVNPTNVIQGHDGSITVAYNDYRDLLLLELEMRIFNNIKVSYDAELYDIYNYIPGYAREVGFSRNEVNDILGQSFYQWTSYIDVDFTKNTGFDQHNAFTFNYRNNYAPDGTDIPAAWRGIYNWILDTDRPHICPWEMIGFSLKPNWWNTVYGPAPYTSNNDVLWDDMCQGIIREPGRPIVINNKFARPILREGLPVDTDGNLLDPIQSGMACGVLHISGETKFIFGDFSPVESAWRKSAYYPFALLRVALLMRPNMVLSTCLDRSRIVKNKCNQLMYSTGRRIRLKDIVLPSITSSTARIQASGLINYLVDYINADTQYGIDDYIADLNALTNNISSKLGGFSSIQKFKLLLDSKSPTSSNGNFIPEENYNIILNSSSPIKKLIYSGIIITRILDSYEVRGYSIDTPYFKIHPWTETDRVVRIGGISESYIDWIANSYYVAGKLIKYSNTFYRVNTTHRTGSLFDIKNYTKLPELPVYGGSEAIIRKSWDTRVTEVVNYGTLFTSIQAVADFLQGYGAYLTNQGFVFDTYDTDNQLISNWLASVKEFLFWTTQLWPSNSVISLSPGANLLKTSVNYTVVNDISDTFYKYQIFDSNGKTIKIHDLKTSREGINFSISPRTSDHAIYGATIYLIQKEHVLILDNKTIFNDILYDLAPGYRQERIKSVGYITRNWNGSFDIPGFIFDEAIIQEWQPWTDYRLGDTIRHKEYYYSARTRIAGTETFSAADWIIQPDKPVPRLLPNWDYKAEQFTDFYDLDTDNFDSEQQRMAQHLIGYQKRQYLANIIKDDVSQYKFYQGMIREKGTQNVFSKLFDVLSSTTTESVIFNEEWAVRCGEYGGTDIFDTIEFILDEIEIKTNPQVIELVDSIDHSINDFIYRHDESTLYIKPNDYTVNSNKIEVWPVTNKTAFLRTPGYVRYEDVKYSIDSLNDILSHNIDTFIDGDLIWCAFEERDWDVYQYNKLIDPVTYSCTIDTELNISLANDEIITIRDYDTTDYSNKARPLRSGDIIGIKSDNFSGFVVVDSTSDYTIKIIIPDITNGDLLPNLNIYLLNSHRYGTFTSPSLINNKIWVDNYEGGWAVFEKVGSAWNKIRSYEPSADNNKIKKAYLYNKKTSTIIKYLDVVDAYHGKIAGIAEQDINYKTYHDPALYSIGDNFVTVRSDASWGTEQVGKVWWDLTRAKFIDNSDADIHYRSNSWNQLYKTASIDVYEWVESQYLPEDWDALSDTEIGLSSDISGKSKYGNSSYSISSTYDSITQATYYTYYFWVSGKTIIPVSGNRILSVYDIANMIASPLHYGYQCISLLSNNSLIFSNIANFIHSRDTILAIEYWTVDNIMTNYHTEWKLISEYDNTILPPNVEQKWIDSLVGYDFMDRQVPNYSQPAKLRYGIENKPRQSMFVNRLEALKQIIERTNKVLSTNLIVDDYDISDLFSGDASPSSVTGKWDITVNNESELKYIGTALVVTAKLSMELIGGRISNIIIDNPGYGYVNPPTVVITGGDGTASVTTSIDSKGQVISAAINNPGYGYGTNTTIIARPFSALVLHDSNRDNNWSIRYYQPGIIVNDNWHLIEWQKFDVSKYWKYIDWYSPGFNQFTKIDYILDRTDQLYNNTYPNRTIVKINNVGTGGWLLLHRINDLESNDYTQMYDVIGRHNGTLEFLDSLYTYDTIIHPTIGNNPDPYSSVLKFELRIILNSIKNNLLINELRVEYLKLFFSSIRYILSEQIYTDWIFKSSFVNVTHNVGMLEQKITYNSDNLQNYEDYINETKPYRTKIRDYKSIYEASDNSNSNIADFDLPTMLDQDRNNTTIRAFVSHNGDILSDNNSIEVEPWKSWNDNVGFKIKSIDIIDQGAKYNIPPVVRFIGGFGTGATAVAFISYGKVTRIKLTNPGTGYLSAPTILLDGGVSSTGKIARACATIESEVVRSTKISMKFDRVSKEYLITELSASNEFTSNGVRSQYKLNYAPDLKTNTSAVSINGIDLLKNEYILDIRNTTANGYTQYYGIITFTTIPSAGSIIVVNYMKHIEYLSANDRINFYYNTAPGMAGKELSQLISGIDYSGVIVTGSGFQFSKGWDTIPWDSDEWDGFDPGYDNYSIVVAKDTTVVQLPYIPAKNEVINIYINNVRIDDVVLSYDLKQSNYTASAKDTILVDTTNSSFTIKLPNNPANLDKVTIADKTAYGIDNNVLFVDGNGKHIDTSAILTIDHSHYIIEFIFNVYLDIWKYSTRIYNKDAVMIPFIGNGINNLINIPLSAYNVSRTQHEKTVVTSYKDNNIIITGNTYHIINKVSTPIGIVSALAVCSLRYDMVFLVNNIVHKKTIILLNTNNIIAVNGGDDISAFGSIVPVVDITTNSSYIINFVPVIDDITVSFINWEFSNGNVYTPDITSVNDPMFKLSSDVAYIYEANDPTIIDEFDKAEFYSAYYYVQISTADNIYLCEVELVHNTTDAIIDIVSEYGIVNGILSANIIGETVFVYLTGLENNISVVYSRTILSSMILRDVDIIDTRRISNDSFSLIPVSYQANKTTIAVIDKFDSTIYSYCKYQIELIASEKTQVFDIEVISNITSMEFSQIYSGFIGKECGYFRGRIKNGFFELLFTPTENNTYISGVKLLIIRPPNVAPISELKLDNTDTFTFIKQASDGSLPEQPYDSNTKLSLNDYDTQLFGGYFKNSNVVGFSPDDIITDGSDFITPISSYAPEEMLPGHVMDTVAIKVFELPKGGSPKIIYNHYTPDGITTIYNFGQPVSDKKFIMVKQGSSIITDYIIDWKTQSIILQNPLPILDGEISIISFGFNSNFLLDTDRVVLSKASSIVITRAPWLLGKVKSTVLVNGLQHNHALFRTSESNDCPDLTGIRFGADLPVDSVIQYMIEKNENGNMSTQTTSVMDITTMTYNGPNTSYVLKDSVIAPNSIVLIGSKLLNPGRIFYYTMELNNTTFKIPKYSANQYQYNHASIKVYVDSKEITYIKNYSFDMATNTIIIKKYSNLSVVTISLDSLVDYTISKNNILHLVLDNIVDLPPVNSELKIISFFDYGTVDIERSVDTIISESTLTPNDPEYSIFNGKTSGNFVLRNPVLSDEYLWVSKNRNLLTRVIDYSIDEDRIVIKLKEQLIPSDVIQIISFSNNITRGSFGFMQFKDILNRVHYKRLDKTSSTWLTSDLLQTDDIIHVKRGIVLDEPNQLNNVPGIIEINGERIEYFQKNENELSQLRRGTLGTSIPTIHKMRTNIINMGPSETIPYIDNNIVSNFVTNRTTSTIPVPFNTNRRCNNKNSIIGYVYGGDSINNAYNLSLLTETTDYDYYEVTISGVFKFRDYSHLGQDIYTFINFNANDILAKRNNTWAAINYDVTDDIEVYVGGVRLKKDKTTQFMPSEFPYSPESDVVFNPEYTVNGGSFVRLEKPAPKGTQILIIKREGKMWTNTGEELSSVNNKIAKFIREVDAIWPQYLVDKYQYVVSTDSDLTLETDGTSSDMIELD